jgi:hypothetical protein
MPNWLDGPSAAAHSFLACMYRLLLKQGPAGQQPLQVESVDSRKWLTGMLIGRSEASVEHHFELQCVYRHALSRVHGSRDTTCVLIHRIKTPMLSAIALQLCYKRVHEQTNASLRQP